MTWKTLAESLESALASMMIDGDEVAGTRLDAVLLKERKGPDAETPGQVVSGGDTTPLVQEVDASRYRHTGAASPIAAKKGSPAHPVCLYLVVDNGGGPARGGRASGAAYRIKPSGERASEFLRLVV